MNIVALLFGVSIGLIIVPFLVDRFINPSQVRTKDLFPSASDYWTERVLQLKEGSRGPDHRNLSKKAYLNEYK